MSEVAEKLRTRKEEVPCEGKCGYIVKLINHEYVSEDKTKTHYGMYVKDELQSLVCLDCYAKGIRLKTG